MTIYASADMRVRETQLVPFFTNAIRVMRELIKWDVRLLYALTPETGTGMVERAIPVTNYWSAPSEDAWHTAWAEVMKGPAFGGLASNLAPLPGTSPDGSPKMVDTRFMRLADYSPKPTVPDVSDLASLDAESLIIAADDGLLYRVHRSDYTGVLASEHLDPTAAEHLVEQGAILAAIPESSLPVRGTFCYLVNLRGLRALPVVQGPDSARGAK